MPLRLDARKHPGNRRCHFPLDGLSPVVIRLRPELNDCASDRQTLPGFRAVVAADWATGSTIFGSLRFFACGVLNVSQTTIEGRPRSKTPSLSMSIAECSFRHDVQQLTHGDLRVLLGSCVVALRCASVCRAWCASRSRRRRPAARRRSPAVRPERPRARPVANEHTTRSIQDPSATCNLVGAGTSAAKRIVHGTAGRGFDGERSLRLRSQVSAAKGCRWRETRMFDGAAGRGDSVGSLTGGPHEHRDKCRQPN